MSYGLPAVYAQPESLSIPATLIGDDLKTFGRGSKNTIRSIPTSSGTNIGPSGTFQFNIPVGGLSYIKPNSIYIRGKWVVTQTGNANVTWGFGKDDVGGASSLFSRITLNCGGVATTYSNYNHFRNAILPHAINGSYITTELMQLEHAGVLRVNTTDDTDNKELFFSIPLWIPAFTSNQAFPALLLSSPMMLEILTSTVNNAIYSATAAVTGYALSDLFLVYETIDVTPEFKSALMQSKANSFYNISLNDWWSVGPTSTDTVMRYQIGCGLSSLRSVLFTEVLNSNLDGTIAKKKNYTFNGLSNYNIYVNNLIVSAPVNNLDDSMAFAEMNRALGRINDSNIVSYNKAVNNTDNSGSVRSVYPTEQFLGGCSTQVFSDWGFTNSGIEASTVTVELEHNMNELLGGKAKWQGTTAYAAANLYVFLMHDSVFSINMADGTVQIRK